VIRPVQEVGQRTIIDGLLGSDRLERPHGREECYLFIINVYKIKI
jgi:hypothetical protein